MEQLDTARFPWLRLFEAVQALVQDADRVDKIIRVMQHGTGGAPAVARAQYQRLMLRRGWPLDPELRPCAPAESIYLVRNARNMDWVAPQQALSIYILARLSGLRATVLTEHPRMMPNDVGLTRFVQGTRIRGPRNAISSLIATCSTLNASGEMVRLVSGYAYQTVQALHMLARNPPPPDPDTAAESPPGNAPPPPPPPPPLPPPPSEGSSRPVVGSGLYEALRTDVGQLITALADVYNPLAPKHGWMCGRALLVPTDALRGAASPIQTGMALVSSGGDPILAQPDWRDILARRPPIGAVGPCAW